MNLPGSLFCVELTPKFLGYHPYLAAIVTFVHFLFFLFSFYLQLIYCEFSELQIRTHGENGR